MDNNTITFDGFDQSFRVIDYVPLGYSIWPVKHPEGYILLCRLAEIQPFPDAANIDPSALLALRISLTAEEIKRLCVAVMWGATTLAKLYTRLHATHNTLALQRYNDALIPMEKIQWEGMNYDARDN